MAELDFYQKDMEKIQKKLLNKIEKVLAGLEVLDDAALAQAFQQIDFVDDLNRLGFPALLEKVKGRLKQGQPVAGKLTKEDIKYLMIK